MEPIDNSYGDNENRIATPTRIPPPLYNESNIITMQPNRPGIMGGPNLTPRNMIPSVYSSNSFLPRSGLDYLQGLASVHIQQTFELNDIHSSVSSENRFTIRTPANEAIFAAAESSTHTNRLCHGSARPFTMHLLDKSHQEVLTMHRKLPCSSVCCMNCTQTIEVWLPPGDIIGIVREPFSFLATSFNIESQYSEILYRIMCPLNFSCCFPKEAHFKILSGDGLTQKGTISRTWNTDLSSYTINIYFANSEMDVKHKSMLIAVGFLMEYKFFQGTVCR